MALPPCPSELGTPESPSFGVPPDFSISTRFELLLGFYALETFVSQGPLSVAAIDLRILLEAGRSFLFVLFSELRWALRVGFKLQSLAALDNVLFTHCYSFSVLFLVFLVLHRSFKMIGIMFNFCFGFFGCVGLIFGFMSFLLRVFSFLFLLL